MTPETSTMQYYATPVPQGHEYPVTAAELNNAANPNSINLSSDTESLDNRYWDQITNDFGPQTGDPYSEQRAAVNAALGLGSAPRVEQAPLSPADQEALHVHEIQAWSERLTPEESAKWIEDNSKAVIAFRQAVGVTLPHGTQPDASEFPLGA